MKKRIALLMVWMMIWGMASGSICRAAEQEEETITPNRVTAALSEANAAAEPFRTVLDGFLTGDENAWIQAAERGKALEAALKAAKDHITFTLEGDTSLEEIAPLTGSVSKVFTIDLNGFVLYAPTFATGSFALKNGTVADLMAENEEGVLKLTVEEDTCVLCDRNPAAMDMLNAGDLTLVNRGMINGFRRLLYQGARSNRISIENNGILWSDSTAFSSRAFHQNSRVTLTNNGVMAGLVRGLDFHCAGGSITANGGGIILGAAGPDLEFPKVTLNCFIVADDLGLTEEEKEKITGRLNPYGDKDAPTGVALDLQANQADYWMTWKVTGTLYASQSILRVKFPQNQRMRGDISPAIAEDSPSRSALMTAELDGARNELTGDAARRKIDELLKTLKMEGFCANGGEIRITALSRYAEADGKAHIRYSTGDSLWSRISGIRTGKTYDWDTAENGVLDAQEPVKALNAYYQMKTGISLAGKDGVLMLDQDVELPMGDGAIPLPQGIEIRGDGRKLTGAVNFTVNQSATLSDLEATETPVIIRSAAKTDTILTLRGGHYGTLQLDNIIVEAENAKIDTLEMTMWGGRADYRVSVDRALRLISTERISGAFRFLTDIGADRDDAEIDITLMKGNQSKTFLFEGITGAKAVTVQILNDRDPTTAFRPAKDSDLNQTYAVYLRVINLQGLRRPDGSRPKLVFRDEKGNALHAFTQENDGQWTLAD